MGRVRTFASVAAGCAVVLLFAGACTSARDWRSASSEPVGLAPDPLAEREALVQVYAARTWGWRGWFGVHTWVAVKPSNASAYKVYEVIGWRLRSGQSVVSVSERHPDARWFGNFPELIADKRGRGVDGIIERIENAVAAYPYASSYSAWPGPNSNTFTAWVLRAVPELRAELPPTAIGKDYLGERIVSSAPSGSGHQFSLLGLFGIAASGVEGLELNVLGLTFGINPFDPSLKLPLIGRLGPERQVDRAVAAQ
ncbi:MAG: DUF3750 domain-containing protein [Burkholderiales bacterium]|nr:DUF3750 domain-containing protein [Burkholderiales bacterium]